MRITQNETDGTFKLEATDKEKEYLMMYGMFRLLEAGKISEESRIDNIKGFEEILANLPDEAFAKS